MYDKLDQGLFEEAASRGLKQRFFSSPVCSKCVYIFHAWWSGEVAMAGKHRIICGTPSRKQTSARAVFSAMDGFSHIRSRPSGPEAVHV